ncbi:MAG TPA: hypothetical protein VHT73_05865 [Thermodesulfobacteriota bacterium]|nr:hypothetical protein [Thermodesulfobacteriota bacterium]
MIHSISSRTGERETYNKKNVIDSSSSPSFLFYNYQLVMGIRPNPYPQEEDSNNHKKDKRDKKDNKKRDKDKEPPRLKEDTPKEEKGKEIEDKGKDKENTEVEEESEDKNEDNTVPEEDESKVDEVPELPETHPKAKKKDREHKKRHPKKKSGETTPRKREREKETKASPHFSTSSNSSDADRKGSTSVPASLAASAIAPENSRKAHTHSRHASNENKAEIDKQVPPATTTTTTTTTTTPIEASLPVGPLIAICVERDENIDSQTLKEGDKQRNQKRLTKSPTTRKPIERKLSRKRLRRSLSLSAVEKDGSRSTLSQALERVRKGNTAVNSSATTESGDDDTGGTLKTLELEKPKVEKEIRSGSKSHRIRGTRSPSKRERGERSDDSPKRSLHRPTFIKKFGSSAGTPPNVDNNSTSPKTEPPRTLPTVKTTLATTKPPTDLEQSS